MAATSEDIIVPPPGPAAAPQVDDDVPDPANALEFTGEFGMWVVSVDDDTTVGVFGVNSTLTNPKEEANPTNNISPTNIISPAEPVMAPKKTTTAQKEHNTTQKEQNTAQKEQNIAQKEQCIAQKEEHIAQKEQNIAQEEHHINRKERTEPPQKHSTDKLIKSSVTAYIEGHHDCLIEENKSNREDESVVYHNCIQYCRPIENSRTSYTPPEIYYDPLTTITLRYKPTEEIQRDIYPTFYNAPERHYNVETMQWVYDEENDEGDPNELHWDNDNNEYFCKCKEFEKTEHKPEGFWPH